ncbi:hypothetical protein [Sphingomonas sp. BK069]|uniref:hypothetical protein n=1 Tax=Sphingomonas sp. BK069 TaxID=2586979 RepID=UPI0016084462|nr:hypothetical protein [Sphingomonas sp. BK069]MBB3348376.1 hypothetical protein [Sphingomonas sp. BK069]
MLTNLENVYLGVLRVVILIAASVALLLTAWGLASSVPQLLRWAGLTETAPPTGGTLREFISERRITDTTAESQDTLTRDMESYVDPSIREAAKAIVTYLGKRGTLTAADLERSLQAEANRLPGEALAYGQGVKSLAMELAASKGRPLTEMRVLELLQWHRERFVADLAARQARETEANAKFWIQVTLAGAAFLGFVLIVFVFLFVKIERSLRLIGTARVKAGEPTEHAA